MSEPMAADNAASLDETISLPLMRLAPHDRPDRYLPDDNLIEALRVARILGQPLLLTGDPGTGKTQFAAYVAWALSTGAPRIHQSGDPSTFHLPLIFETKSTSTSRDLFYTYDMVARFHAAQTKEGSQRSVDYLTYNALGVAILHSLSKSSISDSIPSNFTHLGQQRFVVVIDEIDKAPRDFPNDILNEIDGMYFRVPELHNKSFRANPEFRPVVIITSNSERNLPDAFLRRCVYYHIPFPERAELAKIIRQRIPQLGEGGSLDATTNGASQPPFVADALNLFLLLRKPAAALSKAPATAELIGWLKACIARSASLAMPATSGTNKDVVRNSLYSLIKTKDDLPKAATVFKSWADGATP